MPAADKPAKPLETAVPATPPWWRTLRADPPFAVRMLIGGAFVALIFLVWWFLTRGDAFDPDREPIISPSKLPQPGKVLGAYSSLRERGVTDSILATLERVLLGVGLAAIVGMVLGVISGAVRAVSAVLAPAVVFLRSIPMGALFPLMVMLFSTGEKAKVMFIFFAVLPFVFSDAVKAISIVPERYVETAQTLGASRFQILHKVLLPLALPDMITSLRFQFGLALGYVMLAEAVNANEGIGHMLNLGETRGLVEDNYLLLIIIAVLAFLIDLFIRFIQRGIFQWRRDL